MGRLARRRLDDPGRHLAIADPATDPRIRRRPAVPVVLCLAAALDQFGAEATSTETAMGPARMCCWMGRSQADQSCDTLLEPPAGLRTLVAPLILFLTTRFCSGDSLFQLAYAARANGMRRRSFMFSSSLRVKSSAERGRRTAHGLRDLPRERPGRNVTSSTARCVRMRAECRCSADRGDVAAVTVGGAVALVGRLALDEALEESLRTDEVAERLRTHASTCKASSADAVARLDKPQRAGREASLDPNERQRNGDGARERARHQPEGKREHVMPPAPLSTAAEHRDHAAVVHSHGFVLRPATPVPREALPLTRCWTASCPAYRGCERG